MPRILFCGTPDQVYEQIIDFCEYCGGMGNLLMMGHAGAMSHADTVDNLTLFAKEVLPRLKEYRQPVGHRDRRIEPASFIAAANRVRHSPARGACSSSLLPQCQLTN